MTSRDTTSRRSRDGRLYRRRAAGLQHSVMAHAAALELNGLVKSFRTRKGVVHAVRDVDISIRGGEIVALLGPNGAGKSTTIDLLLGLATPDAGMVRVLGMPPEVATRGGAVGVMLQTGSLLRDLSVRELVTMMAALYPRPMDVDEVLHMAGIETIARRRTQKLSGGETQRVRFALALVSNPEVLVLDEPTVALDVEARVGFWTTIRAFAARGRAVLFATHHLEEADSYADRAVLMADGRVVADSPTNEIKAMVGRRTIRATLEGASLTALRMLPGVERAERRGESVILWCTDADVALRALLDAFPDAHRIEVTSAGFEEAFLELTSANGKSEIASEEALR
jgi:ABC-2 type transport system ATP-binding protein